MTAEQAIRERLYQTAKNFRSSRQMYGENDSTTKMYMHQHRSVCQVAELAGFTAEEIRQCERNQKI